jgi:rsbT co-antagonist protein RsbR
MAHLLFFFHTYGFHNGFHQPISLTPKQQKPMKQDISRLLQKKKKQLLEDWMNFQLKDAGLREDLMSNEELRTQSDELLDSLLKSLTSTNITDPQSADFEEVNEILAGISISRARQGYSPRETGTFIFSLKEAVLKTLQAELKDDPATLVDATLTMNKLMDSFGITTFETFIKGREEVILRQTDEIAEISTPVIRVWDGILALPIIGTLDSARTQIVMESLLEEIVESGSTIAILDISGVPAVDSLVAQHIIKTVAATRLMGAECIISGIRPEIAQTVVHLGIDLSNIVTKASLASALKYAFALLKLEVKKSQREKAI